MKITMSGAFLFAGCVVGVIGAVLSVALMAIVITYLITLM